MVAINNFSIKLKNWSVEMPNAPYSNRCAQCKKEKTRMKEILLAYKKLKENATAQAYTFAIRTSQCSNPKLQKSMLLANALRTEKEY